MSEIHKQLIAAMKESGKTRYQISQESGISQAQLSRMVNGLQKLSIDNAEILAKALGLELKLSKPTQRKRKG